MGGGTTEVHRDDDYLATGAHDRGTSTTLHASGKDFKSCGALVGSYIENETSSENSLIATVTEEEITTDDDLSWARDDVYKIYKTNAKDGLISTIWTDVSRGWKSDKRELEKGWRKEDLDIDRKKPGRVFGEGQPEKKR